MFGDKHPIGQCLWRVIGMDRHRHLPKDRTFVQFRSDQMHGTACLMITGVKRTCMRIKTTILWQERRMNVQHSALPALNK